MIRFLFNIFLFAFPYFLCAQAPYSTYDSLQSIVNKSTNEKQKWLIVLEQLKLQNSPLSNDLKLKLLQQASDYFLASKNYIDWMQAQHTKSNVLFSQNKFKESLAIDSAILRRAKIMRNAYWIGSTYRNVARYFLYQNEINKADSVCRIGIQILEESKSEMALIRIYTIMGLICGECAEPKFADALYYYNKAINLSKKNKDFAGYAMVNNNKAQLLARMVQYEQAMNCYKESIVAYKKLNSKIGLMNAYTNIAVLYEYIDDQNYQKYYLNMAKDIALELNNDYVLGNIYINIANLYSRQNSNDSALFYLEKANEKFEKLNMETELIKTYLLLGTAEYKNKHYVKSKKYIQKALVLCEQYRRTDYLADIYSLLGMIEYSQANQINAEHLMQRASIYMASVSAYSKKELFQRFIDFYNSITKYDIALKYSISMHQNNDSLYNEKVYNNILKKQHAYEIESKEKELLLEKNEKELQQAKAKNRATQLYISFGGLFALALVSLMFYRNFTLRKKQALVLLDKNHKIETLIRELHHRVKNNMQVVSGLLALQGNKLEDETARRAMEEGRQRVNVMSRIHQALYVDKELASIAIREHLQNLAQIVAESFGFSPDTVSCSVTTKEEGMPMDRAMPVALIVNELLTNAFKYAFPDMPMTSARVDVSLNQQDNQMTLVVADNGKGLKQGTTSDSFGSQLVETLVNQLDGTLTYDGQAGTRVVIVFPYALS